MAEAMRASRSGTPIPDGSGGSDPSSFYFNVRNLSGSEARGKIEYIERDEGREVSVYDRTGRPMNEPDKERFIDKAERHDYVQRWHVSPPNGKELSREQVRDGTRKVANDYTRDKRSSSIAYAVHDGPDGRRHSNLLIAGEESELRMDKQDINETRARAREQLVEREQQREERRTRTRREEYVPEPRRADPDRMSPLSKIRRERTVRAKNKALEPEERKAERRRDHRKAREKTREREERADRSRTRGRIDTDPRRARSRARSRDRLDAERTRRDMTREQSRDRLEAEHGRREVTNDRQRARAHDRREREALARAEHERAREERLEQSRGIERGMGR